MKLRVVVEPHDGATYADQLAAARAAEHLGFDGFFRSDHYLPLPGNDGLPGPTDAWVTLAALAVQTSGIRLGTLVTAATFRLPGPLAITVAQVDQMSGGRIELGLGAGWREDEHIAYGIPFPLDRFSRLEEQLAVVTGLWGTPADSTFSFDGEHYRLKDSPALPKPAQSPLPVIVGGIGLTRTPRLAARYATEYNVPFCSPEDTAARYQRARAAAGGRDLVFSASVRHDDVTGSPGRLVDLIGQYGAVGASRVYLQLREDLTAAPAILDRLASRVMPRV